VPGVFGLKMSSSKPFLVFCWNVRGLGDPKKCTIVRDAIRSARPTIACLQETKLSACNFFKAATFLPPNLASSFVSYDAVGSRGGMLTAWDPSLVTLQNHSSPNDYCLSTCFSSTASEHSFFVTNVYAPSDHRESHLFLSCLSNLVPSFTGPSLLVGDFNLVRSELDKNTNLSNRALSSAFSDKINEVALLELPLFGSNFTWTNKRAEPTLARLDRAFFNVKFNNLFPCSSLHSLPRPTSDHTPLLVTLSTDIPKPHNFRFENAWLLNNEFLPSVLPAWFAAPANADAAGNIAGRLKAVRAEAKVWSRHNRAPPAIIPNCKFLIQLIDLFEENRHLSLE